MSALAEWRKTRQATLQLESGLAVTVKKVGLLDLAARGQVPTPLVDSVMALIQQAGSNTNPMSDLDGISQYGPVIDLVVMAAATSPKITEEPTDTTVGIQELGMLDKITIFNWTQSEGVSLTPFPVEPGPGEDAARSSNRLPSTAQHPSQRKLDGLSAGSSSPPRLVSDKHST